jgi:phosphatidylglycerophosphatase A
LEKQKEARMVFSNRIVDFLATGGYVGYIPFAPGTFGSLWGLLFYYLLLDLPPFLYILITLFLFFIGAQISARAEIIYGKKDDPKIVIDEIMGMMVALIFIPKSIDLIIAAFLLFRIFDIFKLKPIRDLEKIKGGIGVMADDLLAGLMANAVLQIYLYALLK